MSVEIDELKSVREEAYKELLDLLYEISNTISTKLDVDELIKSMISGLKRLGFDKAGVWLFDEAENRLCGTWGTDENGNLRDERDEELPSRSVPALHEYAVRVSDAKVAENLGVEVGTDIHIPRGEKGWFEEIWGSEPPYPGYYERSERGDNIFLPIVVSGKVIGAIGVDNFITGRRIMKEDAEILAMFTANIGIVLHNARLMSELHNRTAFLESILDNANLWINLLDNEGNITLWNKAAEQISGYTGEETTGNWDIWQELFPDPDYRSQIVAEVQKLANGIPMEGFDTRITTKDGSEVLLLWSNSFVKDDAEKVIGTLSYGIDITQQRKLERQLAQSEKMSALGQLISGVAHELNNPLTGVIGYSQLLMGTDCNDKTKRMLSVVNKEATRCHKIVGNLLQFAREYEPKREYVQINDVIESTLDLRRYQIRVDNIQLELHLSGDIPETMADPHQMQQVFINIINNAHQAMVEHADQGKLTVKTALRNDTIVVQFMDAGPGIPQENLENIFDPFFTTKEVGKGTGLGLSICHSIVKEHGGRIYVDSELGKGTNFTIELPVMAEGVARAERSPEKVEFESAEAGSRILVVDDEQKILDLFKDMLDMMGYSAVTARNGNQAMARLDKDEYDLIICDMKMPEFSGEDLYNSVKTEDPEQAKRIVFVTGDTVNPETRTFLQSTGNSYIAKPFRLEEIRQIINKSLSENKQSAQ